LIAAINNNAANTFDPDYNGVAGQGGARVNAGTGGVAGNSGLAVLIW
jgi:hypothetical protein